MLDLKAAVYSCYGNKITNHLSSYRANFEAIFAELDDPMAYAAFLLHFVHGSNDRLVSLLSKERGPDRLTLLLSIEQGRSDRLFRDPPCTIRIPAELMKVPSAKARHNLNYLLKVAQDLKDTVPLLGEVTPQQYIDAVELLNTYNSAENIIWDHNHQGVIAQSQVEKAGLDWDDILQKLINNGWVDAKHRNPAEVLLTANLEEEKSRMSKIFGDVFSRILPILQQAHIQNRERIRMPVFQVLPWLYPVIDFVQHFHKEDYPLVSGWAEFILSLLQPCRCGDPSRITFSDYVSAVRDGYFERWYAQTKCGIMNPAGAINWRQRYIEQLEAMNEVQLQRERIKHNWGSVFVHERIETMKKNQKGGVILSDFVK